MVGRKKLKWTVWGFGWLMDRDGGSHSWVWIASTLLYWVTIAEKWSICSRSIRKRDIELAKSAILGRLANVRILLSSLYHWVLLETQTSTNSNLASFMPRHQILLKHNPKLPDKQTPAILQPLIYLILFVSDHRQNIFISTPTTNYQLFHNFQTTNSLK
jgi:hypothetical protein